MYGADFVSVTKDATDWAHLKPAILGTIMEHFTAGAPLLADDATAGDATAAETTPAIAAVAEDAPDPGLIPGAAAASADPTDYSLGADGTIVVLGEETLTQLAAWLGTEVATLRQLNGMKRKDALVLGRRLKVGSHGVTAAAFERARTEWHRAQQAAYFVHVRIVGTDRHRLRVGESLWSLMRQHGVPAWLLQQYNPDLDFGTLKVGMEINVPRIHAAANGEAE